MAVNIPGGALSPPVYGGGNLPYGGTSGLPGGSSSVFGSPSYGLGVPASPGTQANYPGPSYSGAGGGPIWGGGLFSVQQAVDPQLQGNLAGWLNTQVGRGVTPFNLPTALPFGGTTAPGQLSATANPLLQNLMNFYQTGNAGNIPGLGTLGTIASQGISALPEWQQMTAAMGQNIAQQQAQLGEQFAGMGGLAGTPFGNAMSNFQQGVTAQQNALLGQLQQQNILQGQIPVAQSLMSGATNMGQYAQAVNQQAIQQMMNEFMRTQPQYNPTLGLQYGQANVYAPVLNRAGMTSPSLLTSLLGPALGGIGAGATAAIGGQSTLDAILAGLAAI